MDANGQQFWMVSDVEQLAAFNGLAWDTQDRVIKLQSQRVMDDLPIDRVQATTFFNAPSATVDAFGTWAFVNNDRSGILAAGAFEAPYSVYSTETGLILDIAMGDDGYLYVLIIDSVEGCVLRLIDPRHIEDIITVPVPDAGVADCMVTTSTGGGWLLNRETGQLFRIIGVPKPSKPTTIYDPGTERPCNEDPTPVSIVLDEGRPILENYTAIEMCSNTSGDVALLLWPDDETHNAVIQFITKRGLSYPIELYDAIAPYSLGYVGNNLWAVLFEDHNEAIVYSLPGSPKYPSETVKAVGSRYPLTRGTESDFQNRPFCRSLIAPVNYQANLNHEGFRPRPLYALSKPNYSKYGSTTLINSFDGLEAGTVWHRIYIEANIPAGTGIRLWLSSADTISELTSASSHPHQFGHIPGELITYNNEPIPKGSFCVENSEIPYHKGLLHCKNKTNEAGLFTVLAQRIGKAVRHIKGRYLHVRIELYGNGQVTPELAAIRFYAPRFSYLDKYLPDLYRETRFGDDADAKSAASPQDFLQRFLCLFEGILTPLEDKIAKSYLITSPDTAPADALDWLSQWIGLTLEAGISEQQRRKLIANAMPLYRQRGTYAGLALALDMATGNMVSNGEIVILEDFRLRRTFATIIGADLTVENDPLMMNDIPSANSYLGDTFYLGDDTQENRQIKREFLALYNLDVHLTQTEEIAVKRFFERLSNRITVLVHHKQPEVIFKLVRKLVSLEAPAHITTRILGASHPLIIGLYSLVGVDTYLKRKPGMRPAKVDEFYFGRRGQITQRASLDNRME